ncbi:MAG TPA: 2-oxo acid dehydrogenase subunit E2, partial [Lamprocystis sp. (in: g-proteobacteria)]|nr:2-oxo acid dehydrogenase subunit E2 [Lamprocystis sp. (in: g-proteobacteria)]
QSQNLHGRHVIEPRNRFLSAVISIVEFEIKRPGSTVTFLSQVDLSQIERVRGEAARAGIRKPSYTACVMKAVALALREYPYANRRLVRFPLIGPRVQRFNHIDAAVLIERELPEAPMVAFVDMIRDADGRTLADLTGRLHDLATSDTSTNEQWASFSTIITRLPGFLSRWVIRLPALIPSLWVRYRGGAYVISSPAKYGVDMIAATWPWPLGVSFGLVKDRPVAVDGALVVRPTFTLTLNFDRRIMAGAQAGRFYKRIVDLLESAETAL